MRSVVYILFSVVLAHYAYGQDVKSELEAIATAYSQNNFSYAVEYAYFDEHTSSTPDEVKSGFMKTHGENYHYKVGDYEVVKNTRYTLAIDHATKTLMLDTALHVDGVQTAPEDIESLLKAYTKVERQAAANTITYTMSEPAEGVAYMQMIVNKATGYMQSLVMYFYENRAGKPKAAIRNKLIIRFSEVNMEANLGESYFGIAAYVTKQKTTYQPRKKYKGYHFYTNI